MNPFQDRRLSTESLFRNSMTYWRDGIFFFAVLVLAAFIPLDVRNSTLCLPDLPAAFWANVGLLLLYLASKQPQEVKKGSYGVLAGLALGVSWLCKEAILFSLPFVALYLAWLIYETKR